MTSDRATRDKNGAVQRFDALQMLRAIAALLVVIWHSHLAIKLASANYWIEGNSEFRAAHYPFFLNHLDLGVDVFFCISGFIMSFLICKVPPHGNGSVQFLINRAIRVFPPYWFFTLLVVIAYVISNGKFNVGHLSGDWQQDARRLALSLALLPQSETPVLGVAWTLIHECMFYLLCGIVSLLMLNKRLVEIMFCLAALSVVLWAFDVRVMDGYVLSTFYIEFFAGALAFRLVAKWARVFPLLQVAAALAGFFLLSAILDSVQDATNAGLIRCVGGALIGFFLIIGLIGCDQKYRLALSTMGRLMMRMGDASYTLYLAHWFVLSAMGKVMGLVPKLPVGMVLIWHALSIGLAVLVSVVFSERVEMPIHKLLAAIANRSFRKVALNA